jgi:hypothetical protein
MPRDMGLPLPIASPPIYDPVEVKFGSWSALFFWMEMAYPVDEDGGDIG